MNQTDQAIQTFLDNMNTAGTANSTAIILTAKHGQNPLNPAEVRRRARLLFSSCPGNRMRRLPLTTAFCTERKGNDKRSACPSWCLTVVRALHVPVHFPGVHIASMLISMAEQANPVEGTLSTAGVAWKAGYWESPSLEASAAGLVILPVQKVPRCSPHASFVHRSFERSTPTT